MILLYNDINIDIPYEAVSVEDFKITRCLNDHGRLYVKLLLEEGKVDEYINKSLNGEKVIVTYNDEAQSKIFVGKISDVHMIYEGEVLIMEINCISYTQDFDIKKNSRTFCDLDMTYGELIDTVLNQYSRKAYVDNLTEDSVINEFILQYEESDWQFLKRMATHFNGVLVPDCTEDFGRFYFGIPSLNNGCEICLKDYEIIRDINDYNEKEVLGLNENFIHEHTKWNIVSSEKLELGESVRLNGILCIVTDINIEVYKEEIRKVYTLGIERGIRTTYETNNKIFGMSLPATVKSVHGNIMNVDFKIDNDKQSCSNEKFFTYAIESSAWYCMPEPGSEVHIYFPTNFENEAVAMHAVRSTEEGAKYGEKTQNPDNKSFSHTLGSGMDLTPDNINFAADNSNKVVVNMAQSGDVNICGQDINITASEDVQLGMREGEKPVKPQNIQLTAGKKIDISKGEVLGIELVDEIYVQGPMIKYEGTIKDAVELPEEIANEGKNDAALIESINDNAKQVAEAKVQEAKSKIGTGVVAALVGAVAVAAAAVTIVATGGVGTVAAVALVAGTMSFLGGTALAGEGMTDYSKALSSGDYSRSFNFVRDTVFGGNDTLYKVVLYGSVLVSGVCIAILSGGLGAKIEEGMTKEAIQIATKQAIKNAAKPAIKKAAIDFASDIGMNFIMDYGADGKIDMSPMDYLKSASVNTGMAGMSTGYSNKMKSSKGFLCKQSGILRIGADATMTSLGDYAMNGEADFGKNLIRSYISNKCSYSDPIDGATGSLYIPATDITLPDIHNEFKIERKYESINKRLGVLGMNWTANFETAVQIKNRKANVLCTDGHVETFDRVDGKWVNDKGGAEIYTLEDVNDGVILKSYIEDKVFYFDLDGKLTEVYDKFGNKMNFTYIGRNIETITTFSNYKLFFKYRDNKVIEIKDELGRTVQYKYDGSYLTEVIHVDQGITRYTYDENGYVNSITDQNGKMYTKNFFDKTGRVIRQDFPGNDSCSITYDDSEKEVTFYYEKSGRTEKTRFNNDKLVINEFYEDGTTTEFGYDEYQNRNYEKDRNGNITKREFNKFGRILKEELPGGLINEFVYDKNQNLIKEQDNLGKEILNTYDEKGNLIEKKTKISVGKWKAERFTYDRFGRILEKIDGNENRTKYYYSFKEIIGEKALKDPILVTTSSGYEYGYTYDKVGRNTSITTDYGKIEFGYNHLNFAAEIIDANGNVTKKFYDRMGNLMSFYPPNAVINYEHIGEGYHYEYDHMDRLIYIKNPLGNIEKKIRDSEGNIIKEVNPNYYDLRTKDGVGIEYVYDKDNRKIKTIYPDGGIERFFYDPSGNVIRHISPEYYSLESDDGLGYSYTYDEANHLKSIINEEGITEKTFEYDLHGNIIKETDADGHISLYKYDLVGNITEKKTPAEKDDNGNILYNVVYYEYDRNGNKILEKHGIDLIAENDVCLRCHEINFTYDSENRIMEVSDKYGSKARYRYDCLNHKTYESFKINDDTTKVIHYKYDKVGNLVEKKEEINGRFVAPEKVGKNAWAITKYEYDRNGNITKIITPKGYEIGRVYDEGDRIVEEHESDLDNGIRRSRVYEYDKADNIIGISEYSGSDAEAITKKFRMYYNYDETFFDRYMKSKENDKFLEEKNFEFDKKKKKYRYDEQNRLTHFINFSGNTTRLFYDKNDRIIKQVLSEQYDSENDDGLGTSYRYNIKGQVVEVKNALGQTVTKNTYDPKGNLKTTVDGENNKVEYTYTLLGQIKDITTPNSRKENKKAQSYSYDARGNITGIIDGNGNETSYLLDDWGRITQISAADGGVEKYTYDYAGNITSTTDGNGGVIQYFYNSLGQVCEIKDQEGNSEYFYYDEEGNLTKHIDRNGNHADRRYNIDRNIVDLEAYELENNNGNEEAEALERWYGRRNPLRFSKKEIKQDKLNVVSQKFKYNADGTLSNANFNNMYYNYEYNIEGMLESKSTSGKTLLSYTYDKNNNIKSIKDISGKSSIYEYDSNNRVNRILDDNNNIQAEYDYYINDNVKTVRLGNGVKSDYTYDGDGNVASLVTVTQAGEVLVDYSYAYDLNGNRLQKVSSKHKNYYSYDSMNRLVDSSYDGRQESFTYDKVGNRLTKTTNNITEQYVYNVKNQLKELHAKSGVTYFTQDKQGNTLTEETNAGNNLFEYNTLNQQVKAITKEGNTLVNRYDSEGLRYEIEENEKLSRFIFNKNGDILVETDKEDNVVSRFTRGYELVSADIAEIESGVGEISKSPINHNLSRFFYSVDEQGSTCFIIDADGNVKNEYWYDAFGNILNSREVVHNRITYTGQQFDGVTNQYYLRARLYNPVIGRFTQE
ncbi:DUF6531 domain-containing protein, partial [Clostridium sp. HMSC19A10]|uniref:DUF6531 domain-containing protein n=1 Tax=Clostridium sp. HMSC19A10 TaxID=1581148 RepID=UPI0008A1B033